MVQGLFEDHTEYGWSQCYLLFNYIKYQTDGVRQPAFLGLQSAGQFGFNEPGTLSRLYPDNVWYLPEMVIKIILIGLGNIAPYF